MGDSPLSDTLDCNHCGDVAFETPGGVFVDGDGGTCLSCGMPGHVSCDAETAPYWLELDGVCNRADCDECREQARTR